MTTQEILFAFETIYNKKSSVDKHTFSASYEIRVDGYHALSESNTRLLGITKTDIYTLSRYIPKIYQDSFKFPVDPKVLVEFYNLPFQAKDIQEYSDPNTKNKFLLNRIFSESGLTIPAVSALDREKIFDIVFKIRDYCHDKRPFIQASNLSPFAASQLGLDTNSDTILVSASYHIQREDYDFAQFFEPLYKKLFISLNEDFKVIVPKRLSTTAIRASSITQYVTNCLEDLHFSAIQPGHLAIILRLQKTFKFDLMASYFQKRYKTNLKYVNSKQSSRQGLFALVMAYIGFLSSISYNSSIDVKWFSITSVMEELSTRSGADTQLFDLVSDKSFKLAKQIYLAYSTLSLPTSFNAKESFSIIEAS